MTTHKQIARNVVTSWADLIINLTISFLLVPFIIHRLGDSLYGLWILLGSITGYFGLLNLGVGGAITKYVAEFNARKEYDKIRNLISTSFFIFCSLGLAVIAAGLIIYLYLNKIFNIDIQFLSDTRIALLIVTADMAVTFPFIVFHGILGGLQKYDFLNSASIISGLLRAGLIVYFLNRGHGIVALAIISLCMGLLGKAVIFLYFRFRFSELRTRFLTFNRESARLIFSYSSYTFIGIIVNKLIYYSDSTVIGIFLTSTMITYYAVAWRLVELAKSFSARTTFVFLPKASEMEARGDFNKLQQLFLLGCKASSIISLPILLTYIFLGDIFFRLWIGPDFMSSHIYLIVLLIPQIFLTNQHTGVMIIYGIAKHKFYVLMGTAAAVVNVVLSILLLKIWGLLGVALGTTIPMFIWGTMIMPHYYRKTIGVSIRNYFSTLSMFLLPSAVLSILLWQLRIHYNFTSLISFFLVVGLCAVVFITIAYFVSLNSKDRERIRSLIPKMGAA